MNSDSIKSLNKMIINSRDVIFKKLIAYIFKCWNKSHRKIRMKTIERIK